MCRLVDICPDALSSQNSYQSSSQLCVLLFPWEKCLHPFYLKSSSKPDHFYLYSLIRSHYFLGFDSNRKPPHPQLQLITGTPELSHTFLVTSTPFTSSVTTSTVSWTIRSVQFPLYYVCYSLPSLVLKPYRLSLTTSKWTFHSHYQYSSVILNWGQYYILKDCQEKGVRLYKDGKFLRHRFSMIKPQNFKTEKLFAMDTLFISHSQSDCEHSQCVSSESGGNKLSFQSYNRPDKYLILHSTNPQEKKSKYSLGKNPHYYSCTQHFSDEKKNQDSVCTQLETIASTTS